MCSYRRGAKFARKILRVFSERFEYLICLFRQIKTLLNILQIRKYSNEMQLFAYRWKYFYLINSNNFTQQRHLICEELTTVN